jgi:hypothetical protein
MTETLSILGGGWSAGLIDLKRLPGTVIAVNDSAVFAPKVDIAITMDRLWAENRYGWLETNHAPRKFYVRRSARKNLPEQLPDWVHVFENDNKSIEFSEVDHTLNGTNSGFCALNLAYLLAADRVVLFGFDMNRSAFGTPYWFPDYPWAKPGGATTSGKYKAWAAQFLYAAQAFKDAGIEVLNASLTSAIDDFQKVDPAKVLV